MNISTNPVTLPIILSDEDDKDGYTFLGFNLSYSDDVYEIIEYNLKSKMFNIPKFYAWIEYNEDTLFFIKMRVLYGCMFASLLFCSEAWGDLKKRTCYLPLKAKH